MLLRRKLLQQDAPAAPQKSGWDIVFGFSGLLAVFATLLVAFITYKQNTQIQALQARATADVEKIKSQSSLAVQQSAGETSITVAELNTALNKQLGLLTDDRERLLSDRDLQLKRYINDENVRLGRYSQQSNVDLKLVEVATELLKSESTQSNQELRHWAVDIVNSHSNVQMTKAAAAEAIAGPIVGEPVDVFVNVTFSTGPPVSGCAVKYRRPGTEAVFEFPFFTDLGFSDTHLSKGAYEFWAVCGSLESPKKQLYAQTSPLKLQLQITPPQ
jgi:hypothetical protein